MRCLEVVQNGMSPQHFWVQHSPDSSFSGQSQQVLGNYEQKKSCILGIA